MVIWQMMKKFLAQISCIWEIKCGHLADDEEIFSTDFMHMGD